MARTTDDYGDAMQGRFGAGLQPAIDVVEVRVCPTGTVLGNDGLCYNKGSITNAQRQWPRGRRPLLTGGEMKCIAVAARAANKIKTTEKRLQKLGLLQRPRSRSSSRKMLPAAHHAHVSHD